ncbi:hypothetical protein CBD41_06790 [bacterium TMED181]|nr:hypothetical protein [Planctomycetota bacterium]OUW43733.1 MAG: hypothetical protein CBD41_06790 [bacterium TMED181]
MRSLFLRFSPMSSSAWLKSLVVLCLPLILFSCSASDRWDPLPDVSILGGPGRGVGKLFQPRAITTRKNGGCVIIDRSGRAQVFDNSGKVIAIWSLPEWTSGHPIDLCETPEGHFLVADTHYMRVLEFDSEGVEVRRFGEGSGLELVRGIDIAPDGSIYVASYGEQDRIFRFSREGEVLNIWGMRGDEQDQFLRPEGLAVAPDGTVLVVDCGHQRILRFSPEGEFLQQIGGPGSERGQFAVPFDVDVLRDGTILVVDRSGCLLQVFSEAGDCLAQYGGLGRSKGELHEPRGISARFNSETIEVFIADTGNNRISRLQIPRKELR